MKIGNGPSASRLKTFESCLFKYWLTYHAKVSHEMKSNWGAEHGTLLHDILEFYVTGEDKDWRSRLYRGYQGTLVTRNRYGQDWEMPSPLRVAKPKEFAEKPTPCDACPYKDAMNNRCGISHESLEKLNGCPKGLFELSIQMLESAFRRYDEWFKDSSSIIAAEYQCEMPISGLDKSFNGIFDLVIQLDEDTVWIVDYKTGVKTQNYDELADDLQAKAYFWAGYMEFIEDANNKGYKFKHLMVTFDYFQSEPITIAFSAEERKAIESEIRDRTLNVMSQTTVSRVTGRRAPDPNRRGDWMCRYLCDIDICNREWNKLEEEGRVKDGSFKDTEN